MTGIAGEPKEERVALMISASELRAIDDYRFANRMRSRAEAMRHLCRAALAGGAAGGAETAAAPLRGGLRWEVDSRGAVWAHSGGETIGFVSKTTAGHFAWKIMDITGSRHQPATSGRSSTLDGGKRALARGWKRWLDDRGLVPAGGG